MENEIEYDLFVKIPYDGSSISQFIDEERDELVSLYGECDKEIDVTPLYTNNANKVFLDTLEYWFCLYVFGKAKKLIIISRFYKIVIPFGKIVDFKRIDETTVDINLDSLSHPNIQVEFYSKSEASDLCGILNVIKNREKQEYNNNEDINISKFDLDGKLEKINPNGDVSLTQMNSGCSITLLVIVASSIACSLALL